MCLLHDLDSFIPCSKLVELNDLSGYTTMAKTCIKKLSMSFSLPGKQSDTHLYFLTLVPRLGRRVELLGRSAVKWQGVEVGP